MKAILAVLAVIVAGLCWALYDTRTKARERHEADTLVIGDYSNKWAEVRALLEEQQRVNTSLNSTLDVRNAELDTTRGRLSDVTATLARTEAEKAAEKKQAEEEIARRDQKIASLESRNDDLGRQMTELNTSIEGLEQQIADTEQKLAQSEGDKQALMAELTRLRAEKARLETQLNDLAFLRDQVRKLKDELSLARRLDWIRRGIYGNAQKKGAQRLQDLAARNAPAPAAAGATSVEIRQDGSITVNTNAAPPAPR
jgi:chromosome segregation ATPase